MSARLTGTGAGEKIRFFLQENHGIIIEKFYTQHHIIFVGIFTGKEDNYGKNKICNSRNKQDHTEIFKCRTVMRRV